MARRKKESLFLKAGKGLVGLGKEIAKPAIDYGAFVGEAIATPFKAAQAKQSANRANLQADRAMRMALGKPTQVKMRGLRGLDRDVRRNVQRVNGAVQPTFMTSPERRKAYARIQGNLPQSLTYGLQKTAGAASYLLPAGKSFKAAATLGALGGGAIGFSQDADTFEEALGNVAGGALAGGITGGAFYGLGKGLSKLGQRGTQAADDAAKAKGSRLKGESLTKYKKTRNVHIMKNIDELNTALDDVGINLDKTRPDEAIRMTSAKIGQYQDDINNSLAREGKSLDVNKLLKTFGKKLDDNRIPNNTRKQQEIVNYALRDFDEVGNDFLALNKLKSRYTDIMNKIRVKESLGTNLTPEDRINKAVFETIKEVFDDQAGLTARMLNSKQAKLYKLGEELATRMAGETDIAINVPLTNAKAPLGFTQEGAERLGKNIKGGVMRPVRAAGRGAMNAANVLAPIVSSPYAQYGARQVATANTFRERPEQLQTQPQSRTMSQPATQPGGDKTTGGLQIKTAADLYSGRATMNDFVVTPDGKRIWNPYSQSFMLYNAKAFGAAGVKGEGFEQAQLINRQLDQIEGNFDNILQGRIGGKVERVKSAFGDPDLETLQQNLRIAAPVLGKNLLELGRLTDEDVQLALSTLPDENSTPEETKRFIENMRNILIVRYPEIYGGAQ